MKPQQALKPNQELWFHSCKNLRYCSRIIYVSNWKMCHTWVVHGFIQQRVVMNADFNYSMRKILGCGTTSKEFKHREDKRTRVNPVSIHLNWRKTCKENAREDERKYFKIHQVPWRIGISTPVVKWNEAFENDFAVLISTFTGNFRAKIGVGKHHPIEQIHFTLSEIYFFYEIQILELICTTILLTKEVYLFLLT